MWHEGQAYHMDIKKKYRRVLKYIRSLSTSVKHIKNLAITVGAKITAITQLSFGCMSHNTDIETVVRRYFIRSDCKF